MRNRLVWNLLGCCVAIFLFGCGNGKGMVVRPDAGRDLVSQADLRWNDTALPGADTETDAPAAETPAVEPDASHDVDLSSPVVDGRPDVVAGDATDAVRDAGSDNLPPTAVEVGTDSGDSGQTCWYTRRISDSRFSFTFISPDGQERTCRMMPGQDAGVLAKDLVGRVTAASDTSFTLDTCETGLSCSPTLYQFKVTAPQLKLAIPVGRHVRVTLDFEDIHWYCMQALVVSDEETPSTKGIIWFVGQDGYRPGDTSYLGPGGANPYASLPFTVVARRLGCNPSYGNFDAGFSAMIGDDFAFDFAPGSGGGASLSLAMKESGTLSFPVAGGMQQSLELHNGASYETNWTDDYWNWDFWGTNLTAIPTVADGGAGDSSTAPRDAGSLDLGAPTAFPDLFEGTWLFGWSGGLNHRSWIRFSAMGTTTSDAAQPGSGTVDILAGEDAVSTNMPYWPCSGRGRWFITQMPDTISIELPAGCTSPSEVYTVTSIGASPSYVPGSLQRVALTRAGFGMPIEAFRFPDSQCDAAMTVCQPAR